MGGTVEYIDGPLRRGLAHGCGVKVQVRPLLQREERQVHGVIVQIGPAGHYGQVKGFYIGMIGGLALYVYSHGTPYTPGHKKSPAGRGWTHHCNMTTQYGKSWNRRLHLTWRSVAS